MVNWGKRTSEVDTSLAPKAVAAFTPAPVAAAAAAAARCRRWISVVIKRCSEWPPIAGALRSTPTVADGDDVPDSPCLYAALR